MSIAKELAHAEKFYAEQLKSIKPMHDAVKGSELFNSNQIRTMFEEFQEIEGPALKFAADIASAAERGSVGGVFVDSRSYIEKLGKYVTASEEGIHSIATNKKNNDEAVEFLKEVAEKVDTTPAAGLTFEASLVLPITALARYKTFLSLLAKEEGKDAAEALEIVTETLKKSSRALKVARGQRELVELDKSFEGTPNLYSPDRFLDVKARVITKHGGVFVDMELFIFNDLVVLATGTGSALTPYKRQQDFSLKDSVLQIVDVKDGDKLSDDGGAADGGDMHFNMDTEFGGFAGGFSDGAKDEEDDDLFVNNIQLASGPAKKLYIHCETPEEKARFLNLLRQYHSEATGRSA